MEEQYLSVILLLGDQDEAAVRACSVAVCAGRQAASQLDGSYVPHLTVVRFAARPEEASALWEEVKEYSHRPSSLMSEGLCFSPHSSGTKTWAMLQFKRADWLDDLQRTIVSGSFASGHPVNNKIGEAYNPHVSLALLEGTDTSLVDLGKFPLFRREFNGFTLAVGINGPYQTIGEIVQRR